MRAEATGGKRVVNVVLEGRASSLNIREFKDYRIVKYKEKVGIESTEKSLEK